MSALDKLDIPPTSDLNGLAINVAEERTADGEDRARSLSRGSGATEWDVFVGLGVASAFSVRDLCSRNTESNALAVGRSDECPGLLRLS